MSGTIVNTYKVAAGTIQNPESIMTTLDKQRGGYECFDLGNFLTTGVPLLSNHSRIEVNGSLYTFDNGDETPHYLANNQGATLVDASNSPQGVPLYLCILPTTATACEFIIMAGVTPYYDNGFGAWYLTGTTTRVIGGCQYSGGAWPVANKWRDSSFPSLLNYLKLFADGLDIKAKSIAGCPGRGLDIFPNVNRNDVIIYNDTTWHGNPGGGKGFDGHNYFTPNTEVSLLTFTTNYPANLHLAMSLNVHQVDGSGGTGAASAGSGAFRVYYMLGGKAYSVHNPNTFVGSVPANSFWTGWGGLSGWMSAAGDGGAVVWYPSDFIVPLGTPGTYKITFIPWTAANAQGYVNFAVQTNQLYIALRDIFGSGAGNI